MIRVLLLLLATLAQAAEPATRNVLFISTDGLREHRVRPPWVNPIVEIAPVAGEIVVFPSWLNHYVEPFTSDDPNAVRIVVSFNATV